MTDSYQIDGVTVTPQPGGYYLLTHPSLPEPIRERGRESAEEHARKIAAVLSASDDENGAIEQQKSPDDATFDPSLGDEALLAQIEALKAKLSPQAASTVLTTPGEVPATQVHASVPRQFAGVMDTKTKAALGSMGVKTKRIVLEENSDIPPTGLFLGHNGRGYVIKPGEEVDVPLFLLDILNNAVMAAPMTDSATQKVLGYRKRMRYPYRVVE